MEIDTTEEPFLKYRVKKSTRIDYADTLEIILESDFTEEEKFFFVRFNDVDRKVKKFHNNVWGLKATRLWIKGKEVYLEESGRHGITETIFCSYKEDCEGICKHNMGLARTWEVSRDDPFYDEKIAETDSIQGILKRIEKVKEDIKPDESEDYILREMENLSIVELRLEEKKYMMNKTVFRKYLEKKLGFEFEYCPIISKDDTLRIIEGFPEEFLLSEEMIRYLTRDRFETGMTVSSLERTEGEEIEKEEWEYEKKQAELIGDEVEKRFRKVLSEFFNRRE